MRCVTIISLVSLCLLHPSIARADDSPAEAAIARGVSLRRAGRDADALLEFRRAYAIEATPRALAQIGLAEAAVEQWVGAEEDVLHALAADDPWIARHHPALVAALSEIDGHLASLVVVGPDGAELWIDGALATRLPRPVVRVQAKHLTLELRAAGFRTAHRELDILPASTEHLAFPLEPLSPPASEAGPTQLPAPVAPSAPGAALQPTEKRAPSPALAWVVAGTGLALSAGVALHVYAFGRGTYYDGDACEVAGIPRSVVCASTRSEALSAQTAAFISYGIAAGGAMTAVALLLWPGASRVGRTGLSCEPRVDGANCAYAF